MSDAESETRNEQQEENRDDLRDIFGDDDDDDVPASAPADSQEGGENNESSKADLAAIFGSDDKDLDLDLELESARRLKRIAKKKADKDEEEGDKKKKKKKDKGESEKKKKKEKERDGKRKRKSEKESSSKRRKKEGKGEGGEDRGDDFIVNDGGSSADEDDVIKVEGGIVSESEEDDDQPVFFDDVINKIKSKGRRKQKLAQEDIEAIVGSFVRRMQECAEEDRQLNQQEKPALRKIQMLAEVSDMLKKHPWHESMLGNGLCHALKAWLEPLPDGSLPNLKIRSELFLNMKDLPVDTDMLRNSDLGKVVMGLWSNPAETPQNKRLAQALIEKWSRPIFGLSTSYAADGNYEDELVEPQQQQQQRSTPRASEGGARTLEDSLSLKDRVKEAALQRKPGEVVYTHARIPQKANFDFKIRPKSVVEAPASAKVDPDSIKGKLQKKMLQMKKPAKVARGAKISIEGRGLSLTI